MKRAVILKILAPAIFLTGALASSAMIGNNPFTEPLPPEPDSAKGCQTLVTVVELGCLCAGGFVFETDDNRRLIPTYPLPNNPTLQGGQRFRANFVLESSNELVVDCFDLGCAASGYPAYFKCLEPVRKKQ